MSGTLDTPKLAYSITQACAASSLGKTTIYAHIAAGRLRAIHVGGRTLIPADSLRALCGIGDAKRADRGVT